MAGWPSLEAGNGAADGAQSPAVPAFAPDPTPTRQVSPRLRLDNGPMVRREIVKLYRGMKAGEIDVVKGAKLVWTLDVLARMLERETVEKLASRLDAVEAQEARR